MVPEKKFQSRSRKNLVPEKSIGTGITKIWYRKKVSEPVSEKKIVTGTEFRCQNLRILKIHNGYRYRIGTGTGIFSFFLVASEPISEKIGTVKSLGIAIGIIWYQKKYWFRYQKYFVPEKSIGIGIV